jgi:hypothetical protein
MERETLRRAGELERKAGHRELRMFVSQGSRGSYDFARLAYGVGYALAAIGADGVQAI